MSRVKNSSKNLAVSIGGTLLIMILGFVTRSVFIKTLGTQYLGISGLFTNIMSMLSLAELGIGSAIIFNLYRPIADDDKPQIILLMNFYRKAYRIIGLAIAILGLCLIPFLPYLIKDKVQFLDVNFIFCLYLFQSVSSYLFFAYKSALIKAHQKDYIVTGIGYYFTVATNVIQILVLWLFHNFTLYILTVIVFNVLNNLTVALKSDKLYPFARRATKDKLDKAETKEIIKNCYAIFIYRINNVVLTATDNLILSAFIGLDIVGLYSNYLLITKAIKSILVLPYNAITASLGNLHATAEAEHEKNIFKVVNFITFWIFGVAAIGVFGVANRFITLWIGGDYALSQVFSLLISVDLYMYGINKAMATYRTTMGLFQQLKYRPVAGIIINLAASIVLVQFMGINGVILGTIIANLLTYMWFDPYVIYKHVFKQPVKEYYFVNIVYLIAVVLAGAITHFVIGFIGLDGVLGFVISGVICVVIPCLLFFLLFCRTKEWRYIKKTVKFMVKNLSKRA